MSSLRPECGNSKKPAMPDETALFLIWQSVKKRRSLIHGRLHSSGQHCAIGAFWEDHPGVTLHSSLIDQVAQVNDSIPPTIKPHERWKAVNEWLKWKLGKTKVK